MAACCPQPKSPKRSPRIRGVAHGQGLPLARRPLGLLDAPGTDSDSSTDLRQLSGGKPTGFKLCIGHPWEFLGIVKAMLETGITPDFIVVDGKEGGTGAAPLEFMDHLGMPLRDGLAFVHSALIGANLRDQIKHWLLRQDHLRLRHGARHGAGR